MTIRKRKNEVDNSKDKKSRKLKGPITNWSKVDVQTWLERSGVSATVGEQIAVAGQDVATTLANEEFLDPVPLVKRGLVKEAMCDLANPLLPKFLQQQGRGSKTCNHESFREYVAQHRQTVISRNAAITKNRLGYQFMSACILLVVGALAFFPALQIADIAVPDSFDLDEVAEWISNNNQGTQSDCRAFLKQHCAEWASDGEWSNSDKRKCARQLHPDKPGGSDELFEKLTNCHEA